MIYPSRNFKQRLATSTIFVCVMAISVILSSHPIFKPVFAVVISSLICVAIHEYYQITIGKGFQPLVWQGIATAGAYLLAQFAATQYPLLSSLPSLVLACGGFSFFLRYFKGGSQPIVNLAITFFGIAYLALTLGTIISIAYFFPSLAQGDGRWWLFYLMAVTKMTDTGAYFTGKQFGQTPMAPTLSPKKTWEGAIGGLICSVATSVAFHYVPALNMTLMESLFLGCAISIIAQTGDLAESLIKRDAGVKHSSHLPGLGGMLDVVDSAIFTAPLVYFFMVWKYMVIST
jgi:phosphatidate cytidylyltransferase